MNNLKYFFILAIGLFVFSSCEEVIELDLNTTEPQLIIEATLDATNAVARVILTKSNDFYNNNSPERISGADINLRSETGTTYMLAETSAGTYVAENIAANQGEVFTISIEVEGEMYEATTQVPLPVTLDEVEVLGNINPPFGGEDAATIRLAATWNDPQDIENFYRIRTYVDDTFQANTYTILNDAFAGDDSEQTVPIQDLFEENTSITVELLSTDEEYYDYFFQVSSLIGNGPNSTTPYNPKGNFSNGALGYFGIYYSSALSVEL